MGLRDKLRDLTSQAQKTAAEHKDELRQTIDKAEATADQQTGGKYHDKIEQAGAKVEAYVDGLEPTQSRPSQTRSDSGQPDSERL